MAAVVLPLDAVRYTEREGFFVIGQRGEDAAIMSRPDFTPRPW